mmetsp:Transcript_66535/g.110633  ORF Transcript_66535/g.110633 Transcript_66535/m.110633 type:complete len:158 (-) Transcript_66535:857-1330(-)
MWRFRLAAAVGGVAALCGTPFRRGFLSEPLSEQRASTTVHLASSVASQHRPTAVLLHGLDSSKETWSGVLADLHQNGYPAIALDLRGHGESPLGCPTEFTPTALAQDVLAACEAHGIGRYVLVGHSMGGRVAMRTAALEMKSGRSQLAAVIIEDMDV